MGDKLYKDKEWLEQKYIIERLNIYKIGKLCNVCGDTINRWRVRLNIPKESFKGKYNHSYKGGKKVKLVCEYCGKNYNVYPCKKKTSNFCSRKCLEKWNSKKMSGSGNPMYGISLVPSKKQREIASKLNKGKNNYFYGKRGELSLNWKKRMESHCDYCGKPIELTEKQMKFKNHFCNRKCLYNWLRDNPQNTPGYKDGISMIYDLIRGNAKYFTWRSDIFKRDNYTCQLCGSKKGGNFQAHHIIQISKMLQYYEIITLKEALECEALWNINNGITLCKKCHKILHSKKFKSWAYFEVRSVMYKKTGLYKFEHIFNGAFTLAHCGDNVENYMLQSGVV